MPNIHVVGDEGDVEIWLDTEVEECDGLCIGHARTRAGAIEDAINELRDSITHLEVLKATASKNLPSTAG